MSYAGPFPYPVKSGGTGRATLTNHGVLVGAGTTAITQLAVASTGQTLMGSTGADPSFTGSPSFSGSVTAATGLTVTAGGATITAGTLAVDSGTETVSTSTAAATASVTISASDNTSSSTNAKLAVSVGGGNAGDPIVQYTVSGVTTWSEGIDNSDSDAYVIAASSALGTTNVMRSSTSGQLTYPLQPCFLAYNSTNRTNQTGNGTFTTVTLDTEVFDRGSNFSSNTFTAPVTGIYHLTGELRFSGITTSNNGVVSIVTTSRSWQGNSVSLTAVKISTVASLKVSVYESMTAGDTAILEGRANGQGADTVGFDGLTGPIYTYFSGKLVA